MVAYLPQPVWEAVGTALAVSFVTIGLFHFFKGSVRGLARVGTRTIRVVSVIQILLGVGLGFAAFLVNAQPR